MPPPWIYPISVLAVIVVGVQVYGLWEAWQRKRRHELLERIYGSQLSPDHERPAGHLHGQ